MAQNVYDKSEFFAGYSKLPRSVDGLDAAPEWPSMRALLPDLRGRRVVDLGCGFGWFCRWAAAQGASSVLGIDVSENMLARARDATSDPAVSYRRGDLDRIELPEAAFDLAYSSLALHYVEDLGGLLAAVRRCLAAPARLVISIEHPIFMAPSRPAWQTDGEGRQKWPVDDYLVEGKRTTDWFAKGVVKQHRMLGTTLNHLIRAGFRIAHVEEWGPTEAQVQLHPEWARERHRPMFLLIAAER